MPMTFPRSSTRRSTRDRSVSNLFQRMRYLAAARCRYSDEDFYLITPSLHAVIEGLPLVASAGKGGLTLALGQVSVTIFALTLGLVQCWRPLGSAGRNKHRRNY